MEITHCDFKIIYLYVLKGVIASPVSGQSGHQAGKGGMPWHRHISGKTGRIQISDLQLDLFSLQQIHYLLNEALIHPDQ